MRKRILASLCLFLSVCVGCGLQVKTEPNPADADQPPKAAEEQPAETAATETTNKPIYVEPKTYEDVLDAIYDFASADPKDRYTAGRTNVRAKMNVTGVHEVAYGDTPEERLSKIGYCIEDISGDGIPELIIGTINNKSENNGTRIISLYTTVDGKAYLAREGHIRIDGWARCRYYLLDNGLLYNEGSGGAANISRSISCLSEDGASVKTLETLSTFPLKFEAIRSGNDQNSSDDIGSHHRIYDENGNCTLEELDDPETRWQLRRMGEDYKSRVVKIDLIPMSEYKLTHEQLRANENYAVCAIREEMGWYIIKDSLEADYEGDMLAIYTDVLVFDSKNNRSQICSYKFVYDEENYQMYCCDNDGELRPLNGGVWNENVRDYCIGDKAHYVVCGERFTRRYSLAERDGYVHCTRHHELIWYIVEDSLKVDSEDDMLVISADVVTLNENTGKTRIRTYKYLYDEENNRMYSRGDDGYLRELIDRGCWAAGQRDYDIGNMAYYAAYGERFIGGVYEETQRLRALGRGNSEVFQKDKLFYTDKDGANYSLRQFHKATDWISAQVVRKDANGKTTDSYLYYFYTYQVQCPYTIYKGTSLASPGEAVERGELYVDSEGTLRSDANPSAVAFFRMVLDQEDWTRGKVVMPTARSTRYSGYELEKESHKP